MTSCFKKEKSPIYRFYPISLGAFFSKSDTSLLGRRLWIHQLLDRFHQYHDLLVMVAQFFLELGNLAGQLLVPGDHLSKLDEGSDHKYGNFDRLWRVQYAGGHNSTVLGKGTGIYRRKFKFLEVVTICYHLLLLFLSETKHKIGRESFGVAADGLIGVGREASDRFGNPCKTCQVQRALLPSFPLI